MGLVQSAKKVAEDRIEQDLRNRIKDTVRSYRHFWDPYSELLQNAVDAINRRFRILNDPDFYLHEEYNKLYALSPDPAYQGSILIEIWPDDRKLAISDNGVGIPCDQIERLLLPEGSGKRPGKEYGYKGKGLTYVAFVSEAFKLRTQHFVDCDTYGIALNGLFDWLVSDSQYGAFPDSPLPEVSQVEPIPAHYNTRVEVQLASNYAEVFSAVSSLDHAFELAKATTVAGIDGFEAVLRTRTALGNTRPLFKEAPIVPIEVQLIVHTTSRVLEKKIPYRFFHPREHRLIEKRSFSFEHYITVECPRVESDKTFRCLYVGKNGIRVGARNPISADILLSAIASTRLNQINDDLGLSKPGVSEAALTYGVYLSIEGMPTGIRVDSWDVSGGHFKRYFAVADVPLSVGDELDAGRKGISSTRAQQIAEKAAALRNERVEMAAGNKSNSFSSYANSYLDWGQEADDFADETDFEAKVSGAQEATDNDRREATAIFDILTEISSLEHIPRTEEEVRVLFHELLASRRIKGYRTVYAGGSRALYDCALNYDLPLITDNLEPVDPLGFSSTLGHSYKQDGKASFDYSKYKKRKHVNLPCICAEFKYSLDGFFREMNAPSKTAKDPKELDMLIVWSKNISSEFDDDYVLSELPADKRILHGATHRLSLIQPVSTEIQCMVLQTVLELIISN